MRARAHIEELRGGKTAIVVNELPYGVKKGGDEGVIKKIADLVNDKVLTEISDVKDLSDKTGMRIQIELKREAIPQVVLNKLYKHTALQATFGYNAVALVDGVPRTLAAARPAQPLPRLPARGRHPPLEVRAAQGRGARARPPRLPDRARQPRRGHRAHPRRRRRGRGPRGADEGVRAVRDPGAGDPRPPPSRSDGARAQARRGRAQGPGGADRRAADDPRRRVADRRPHPRGAARDQADLREERRPAYGDHRRRRRVLARGHDRRGGHGDRDHALRTTSSGSRSPPTASSGAAARA